MLFAHPGHWIVQAVYFAPVVAFLVWLVIAQIKARREEARDEEGNSPQVR
jgi:hypothetical protein